MNTDFITLGFIMWFSAMLPGPDFAIVTKNALVHSRRAGIYTAFGIGAAICVHMTYCVLGFAAVIKESPTIFHAVQYIGAFYLAYIGFKLLIAKAPDSISLVEKSVSIRDISAKKAFRQGFLCNLFNPKATLFFLTLFSVISTAQTSFWISLGYAIEVFVIAVLWFCILSCLLSHNSIAAGLNKIRNGIEKVLGLILLGFAVCMVFL